MAKELKTNMQHCVEHDVYYNAAFWHCGPCFKQQKDMVARLEESLRAWKDAWYAQRTITGRMAWTVPNPFVLRHSDSPLFQKEYQRFLDFTEQLWDERNPQPSNQIQNLTEAISAYEFEPDPFPPMRKEAVSGHWSFHL